ncbi:exonuclease domain-containing protein [Actinacidiphila sp. DG2A-62]|uniref:exonuclease domain-containing protein n=1 Tax=Actinacidiphila sp. DG2A-62 TaxID=3108821 RepID=UPI002DBB164F|nr:exonuclease domain-containing protein [Actinacidiphila sp. DG2A-62]MEC3993968.1 exonuclease domain-containing protein [Actinacidiphila sp. DG2A-62]
MSWHLSPMCAFDTETTGVDTETDRIVSAAVIPMDPAAGRADITEWLADPGIDIPAEATAVHGISTAYARAHGRPAKDVVTEVIAALSAAVEAGVPLVGHNICYDLTITDREARRHLGLGLYEALGGEPLVIDTMVLDRRTAPFRRRVSEDQGPYQMRTTAETYGLGWDVDAAHGAAYDALMSGRVAWHMGRIAHQPRAERPVWVQQLRPGFHDRLRDLSLDELHQRQILWAQLDAENYQKWLRDPVKAKDKHDPEAVIDGTWPLRPVPEAVSAP